MLSIASIAMARYGQSGVRYQPVLSRAGGRALVRCAGCRDDETVDTSTDEDTVAVRSGVSLTYDGGVSSRDSAYHQGTVWPWLMGPFITAYVKLTGGR